MDDRSSAARASFNSSNSSCMSFTRSSHVRPSTTVGTGLTTISKVRWKASTIACSSAIRGSLFAVIGDRFSSNEFYGMQLGKIILRRDAELREPSVRGQYPGFEAPDRFVVCQDVLPGRLPTIM